MAAKVNVKFVVILSTVLVVLAGGTIYLAMRALEKSAADHIRKGDEHAAQGEWDKAASAYSAGVNENQTDPEAVKKWVDALEHLTPSTSQAYNDLYQREYMLALRGLSQADVRSYESQRKYLEEFYERTEKVYGGDLAAWENYLPYTEDVLKRFEGDAKSRDLLRRYRGLARAQILVAKGQPTPDELTAAKEDLEAALAADPSDHEVVSTLSGLDLFESEQARRRQEGARADELARAAKQRITNFLAANQGNAKATASALLRLQQIERIELSRTGPRTMTQRDVAQEQSKSLEETVAAFEKVPPAEVNAEELVALAYSGAYVLETTRQRTLDMMDKAAKAQPNNARFQLAYGDFYLTTGEMEKAVEILDGVAKLPNPPLSLHGLELIGIRPIAVAGQAEAMFLGWQNAENAEERATFLKRAQAYRDALISVSSMSAPRVGSIDARLAFMEGDAQKARALINKYNTETGNRDVQGLLFEGNLQRNLNNRGASEEAYNRVVELSPANIRAHIALSDIAAEAQDYTRAKLHAEQALALQPGNKELTERVRVLSNLTDRSDPVTNAIRESNEILSTVGGDRGAAEKKLTDAIARHGADPRLCIALAQFYLANGPREKALPVLEQGLARNPGHPTLTRMREQMAIAPANDPVAFQIEMLDRRVIPPCEKHAAKFLIYTQAGMKDKAGEVLDAAKKECGDKDPNIADAMFIDAMNRGDAAEMDRIVRLAEEHNLDNLNGVIYRARRSIVQAQLFRNEARKLAGAEGNPRADVRSDPRSLEALRNARSDLRTAVANDKTNIVAWRLLASVELEMGLASDAAASFERALAIRPDDISAINGYVRATSETGALDKALEFARRNEAAGSRDPEFVERWLALESSAPTGNKGRAMQFRQDLAARDPDNAFNLTALAVLLMEDRKFPQAREIVDALKSKGHVFQSTILQAELHARDNNIPGVIQTWKDYIDSIPEADRTAEPYLRAARQLRDLGAIMPAVEFYTGAQKLQDPKFREVDREVADMLYSLRGGEGIPQAVGLYKDILASGSPDDGYRVLARIVEGSLNMNEVKEAETWLAKAGNAVDSSAPLLMLSARLAMAQGDKARASRMLDQAVAADPNSPQAFLARADFNWPDPAQAQDVEQDLKQALRIDSKLVPARMRLVTFFMNQNNPSAAIQQLRDAVSADEGNDEMRVMLIEALLRNERRDEASIVIEETLKKRPNNIPWMVRGSQLMQLVGKKARAIEIAKMAFDQQKDGLTATAYVNALLSTDQQPDMQTALKAVMVPEMNIAKDITARLLRAKIYLKAKKPELALDDMKAAAGFLNPTNPGEVRAFYTTIRELYPGTTDRIALVNRLDEIKTPEGWMKFFSGMERLGDEASRARGLTQLRELAEGVNNDPQVRFQAWGVLGLSAYQDKKYDEAVTLYRKALEIAPNDGETNNNLAYVLAMDLGRPQEAIPYAQRAQTFMGNNPLVLDTVGAVFMEAGMHQQAETSLMRGLQLAQADAQRVPLLVHLAKLRALQGEREKSREILDQLERYRQLVPGSLDPHKAELQKIEQVLQSPTQ